MKSFLDNQKIQITRCFLVSLFFSCVSLANSKDAISARKGMVQHKLEFGEILLADQGVIQNVSSHSIRLLRGTLMVDAKSEVQIETIFGQVNVPEGQVWFIVEGNQLIVKSISSHVLITSKSGQSIEVNRGFESWVGLINSQGRNEIGVPKAIDFPKYLQFWAQYYRGPKKKFIEKANQLREELNVAVVESAELYQNMINRQIASVEEEKAERARIAELKKKETQKKKAAIFEKTFSR